MRGLFLTLSMIAMAMAIPAFVSAEETTGRNTGQITVMRLQEETAEAIAEAGRDLRLIQRLLGRDAAEIQIPAVPTYTLACRLIGREVDCRVEPDGERCPSSIEIEIPSVGRVTMELDCEGPDASGNCECQPEGWN